MSAIAGSKCETPNCNKSATLQCPTCLKIGIQGSFFCGQECFKGYWKTHKIIHALASKQTLHSDILLVNGNQLICGLYFIISFLAAGTGTNANNVVNEHNPYPYFKYTGKLRPYPQTPIRKVPENIARPDYADHPQGRSVSEESFRGWLFVEPLSMIQYLSIHINFILICLGNTTIKVLNDEEIESMYVSCKLGREVLDEAAKAIDIGVTTDEIDRVVHEACIERDCYPSPMNYYNFPASCCTSVNEVICHGIPDTRPLQVTNKQTECF